MTYLPSPIFYMGNKYKLLKQLIPLFPDTCEIFLDLFGGSGVVSMNYQGTECTIYNEFNTNVIELIKTMVHNDPNDLDRYFKKKISEYNLPVCSVKAKDRLDGSGYEERKGAFLKLREDYNKGTDRDYKDLFLLSCYSINHLMRFNKNSEFNAPNGADAYNEKNYKKICDMHEKFKNVMISHKNCFDINFEMFSENDFIYCDPPYLNTEAVYNEKRAFGGWEIDDDYKLFSILEELNRRGVKWGLSNVFHNRGKSNNHLIEWCEKNNWNVHHLSRNYNPFSKGNSNSDEVYICNYDNVSRET